MVRPEMRLSSGRGPVVSTIYSFGAKKLCIASLHQGIVTQWHEPLGLKRC